MVIFENFLSRGLKLATLFGPRQRRIHGMFLDLLDDFCHGYEICVAIEITAT